jgi:hypothetical protein
MVPENTSVVVEEFLFCEEKDERPLYWFGTMLYYKLKVKI